MFVSKRVQGGTRAQTYAFIEMCPDRYDRMSAVELCLTVHVCLCVHVCVCVCSVGPSLGVYEVRGCCEGND